jgi:hypothetical protein
LRLTVKPGQSLHPVFTAWEKLVKEAETVGHERIKAKFPRYQGFECGGLYVMHRAEDMMFEARGAIANKAVSAMKGVEFHGNVARYDAQITAIGTTENCPSPERTFDSLRGHQTRSAAFRGVNLEFKRPAKTGHTCYVGSADSDSHFRIYDAGAVHSDRYPQGAVRWEWQTANDIARTLYAGVQTAASVPCHSTSVVMGKLMSWDIHQQWFTSDPPIAPFSGWKATTDEKSLAWAANFVAATVRRLIERGYAIQLAEILGVKALELVETPNPNAFLSPLSSGVYNTGVMSGSESQPEKRIGLMTPIHSRHAKKLKRGGLE